VTDEPIVDEARFGAVQRVIKVTALRGTPVDGDSCANCCYYLEPGEPLAFCWQEKFQMLVGANWWCQHWEMIAE
jgi:hypothetical protein